MLAKRVDELPAGETWIFEPKWDGFRALVFRDGDEILIQSRDEKPLNRYFPELVEPLRSQLPAALRARRRNRHRQEWRARFRGAPAPPASGRVAGEASVPANPGIHRVLRPALRGRPGSAGRTVPKPAPGAGIAALVRGAADPSDAGNRESSVASDWFRRFEGAGLDGVMAKPVSGTYEPNKRVMLKVKHERDCDCVVAGFRWYKKGERTAVGSLLLGLFDDSGALAARRRLRQLHATRSAGSWWNSSRPIARTRSPITLGSTGRSMDSRTAKPGIACRAARAAGARARTCRGSRCGRSWWSKSLTSTCRAARFRHMAHFRRWRTDKKPGDCTYAQLEVVPPQELAAIFAAGR